MKRAANKRGAGKGGTPLLFHIGRAWPALPDHDRSDIQEHERMKRIVFAFRHKPKDHYEGNQEWRNYTVGDFPKSHTWAQFAGFAILAVGIAIGYWVRHPGLGFLAGIAGCFVLVMAAHRLRCPQCQGSVLTREVEEENGFKRFFHDCPICKISWRDQKRHWDSSD